MSTRETPESGLRLDRLEALRENTTGEIPSDPDWSFFSDNPTNFTWAPAPGAEPRHGLGTPDAVDFDRGNEEHEITVTYDLQKQFVDANGDPDDFAADAWLRNNDNQIRNTHAIVARDARATSDPNDPADTAGARNYVVAKGGHANAEMEGDPEGGDPVSVTVTYTCEKVRDYELFQPSASTLLVADSTDDADTMDLTLENEDGSESETITLNGTSIVTTSSEFTGLDAAELSAESDGDVSIYINDGTATSPAKGTELTEEPIRGANHYAKGDQPLEGDLGVPALGAGSHATDIGTAYEYLHGSTVTRGGNELDYDLNRLMASVENGYDPTPRSDSVRNRYTEGNRNITVEQDVVGWGASSEYISDALDGTAADIVWTLSSTEFTFNNAEVTEPGDKERGPDDTAIQYSATFSPKTEPAVTITQV